MFEVRVSLYPSVLLFKFPNLGLITKLVSLRNFEDKAAFVFEVLDCHENFMLS